MSFGTDCHSGLLSKGPGESADGDHHLRHHHHHNFITIIGFGAQGRAEFSGTVSHPKVQTLSNRTPNQQWPWNGVQPTATTGGAAGGNPHHGEPQGARVGYHGVGGMRKYDVPECTTNYPKVAAMLAHLTEAQSEPSKFRGAFLSARSQQGVGKVVGKVSGVSGDVLFPHAPRD